MPSPGFKPSKPRKSTKAIRATAKARKHQARLLAQKEFADERSKEFDDFGDCSARIQSIVEQMIIGQTLPTWSKGKSDKPKNLKMTDLVVGYFAVHKSGALGLSLERLALAFKIVGAGYCRETKATAILRALQQCDLIVKTKHEVRGKRGCCFEIVPEQEEHFGMVPCPDPIPVPDLSVRFSVQVENWVPRTSRIPLSLLC